MDLIAWLTLTAPELLASYNAWKSIGFTLKPGQWVITLTHGFSGGPGVKCQYLGDDSSFPEMGLFGYVGEEPRWGMKISEYFARIRPISGPGI